MSAAQVVEHAMVTFQRRGGEQRRHGRAGMWQLLQRSQFQGSRKCGCGPLSSLQWAVSRSRHAAAAASQQQQSTAVNLQKQRSPLPLDLCCNACHPGRSMRSPLIEMCDRIVCCLHVLLPSYHCRGGSHGNCDSTLLAPAGWAAPTKLSGWRWPPAAGFLQYSLMAPCIPACGCSLCARTPAVLHL